MSVNSGHIRGLLGRLSSFARNRSGNVAIAFAVIAPAVLMAGGSGVDYARVIAAKSALQTVADGAALAGAQSLRLSGATQSSVQQVTTGFVASHVAVGAPSVTTAATLPTSNVVAVQLDQTVPALVSNMIGVVNTHITVKAQARLAGTALPTCMVALNASSSQAASFDTATLNAQGCLIYSGSSAADAVSVTNGAKVSAGKTCSHGGVRVDGASTVAPAANTDCPALPDPLATRAQPLVGACNFNNIKITSGSTSLTPGVYCGGLQVTGNASVTLLAGTYIIKDGSLLVKAGSSLSGVDVSIFLTGDDATLQVENKSAISLSAPSVGAMAGMLIFEDRSVQLGQDHNFQSRNAPNMLGTIYLSRGNLHIGVSGGGGGVNSGTGVGAASAWTIIVANQIEVTDQQTLTMNTNYNATTVPPPTAMVPAASGPQLIN